MKAITNMLRTLTSCFRFILAGLLIVSIFVTTPAYAAVGADLTITKTHVGNFTQAETDKTYTITVTNSGDESTTGTVTVVDTLPTGLTATMIDGSGWSCNLGTLTCTRNDALDSGLSYPTITVTVNVDVDAPALIVNQATVSGGADVDILNNEANDSTTVIQKADLIITNVTLSNPSPDPNEPFSVNVTVKNQGGLDSQSLVYRHVYVDTGNPYNLPPDPGTGCPSTDDPYENYFRSDFNDGMPAGVVDTKAVDIPELSAGSHELWVFVDATCINDESNETNNAYGPISIEVGSRVDVTIGGNFISDYYLVSGASQRVNYPTLDAGPVKIESTNGIPIIAALREMWNKDSTGTVASTSFTQLMGIPAEQLSDTYYLPHYNDLSPFLDAQLRIANVDTLAATVEIRIGGNLIETVNINPGASYRVNYPTLDAGPVVVQSTNNKKIVVALREMWNNQGTGTVASTSFTQIMGIPKEALSTTYYLPHYNDASPYLDAQLRIANVDTLAATVEIRIGGNLIETVNINPGASYRVNYPTLDAGPVVVQSTNNKKIVVALREMWNNQGTGTVASTSFAQIMGIPAEQLSYTYYLPHYNDASPFLDAQLRIANVDTLAATVEIRIAGNLIETVNINPGASYRVNYPTLDAGPVVVQSTNNKKIVVALREMWNNQGSGTVLSTSFTQIMGLPEELLSTIYYLPHYNDASPYLDAQLRFGVP